MTPELEPILAEIREVMKKHNVMGGVIVCNETHADFQMQLEASWSCAHFEPSPIDPTEKFVRVRAKVADFPTVDDWRKCLQDTTGSFVAGMRAARIMAKNFEALVRKVEAYVEVDRGPGFEKPNHRKN